MINTHTDGSRPIFVFGSNLAGRHGAGAAKAANFHYGAPFGAPEGPMGSSYAIPTKTGGLESLTLDEIKVFVDRFLAYANSHPDLHFHVTRIGCVLAGYTDADIAPMFKPALPNCSYAEQWKEHLT